METITNVAAAASKAIFGEQKADNETGGQEPVSGEQGRGTSEEPFDRGNAEAGNRDTIGNETAGREPISGAQGQGTTSEPFDKGNADDPVTGATKSTPSSDVKHHIEKSDTALVGDKAPASLPDTIIPFSDGSSATNTTGTTDEPKTSPANVDEKTTVDSSARVGAGIYQSTETTGAPPDSSSEGLMIVPSERSNPGPPGASAGQHTEQQGADKPSNAPTGEQQEAVKGTKHDAEELLKKRDPNDHSGEPMKMHPGGGATQEERRTSTVGNPGGQEHGKEAHGTGEKWEKSTGVAAEGGNFDATKPGAGREADRLMEDKGVRSNTSGASQEEQTKSSPPGEHKEKVSMREKIKGKLHIGHKDK